MLCKVPVESDLKTRSLLLVSAQNILFSCVGVSSRVWSVPSFVVASTVVHVVDNLHCVSPSHWAQENSTAEHKCWLSIAFTMTTTQERPVISDEEFDEDATVRLSDFTTPPKRCSMSSRTISNH